MVLHSNYDRILYYFRDITTTTKTTAAKIKSNQIKLYIYTAPPTSMRAQTRQFLTIAWTVPVRCLRSSDCQADCSAQWGRKHGSFWVQNGQCVCVRWSVLHGQRIVVGHALEPSGLECRCLRNMLDICRGCSRTPSAQVCMWCAAALVAKV